MHACLPFYFANGPFSCFFPLVTAFTRYLQYLQDLLLLRDEAFELLRDARAAAPAVTGEDLYYIHVHLTDLCITFRESDTTWQQLQTVNIPNALRSKCRDALCLLAIHIYDWLE